MFAAAASPSSRASSISRRTGNGEAAGSLYSSSPGAGNAQDDYFHTSGATSKARLSEQSPGADPLSQRIAERAVSYRVRSMVTPVEEHQPASTLSPGDRAPSRVRQQSTAGEIINGIGSMLSRENGSAEKPATADSIKSYSKKSKKSVSFLTKMIGGAKLKSGGDDEETLEDITRREGLDADLFSQPLGHVPRRPALPKYIRVRSSGKSEREFNRVFLAQELQPPVHDEPKSSDRRRSSATAEQIKKRGGSIPGESGKTNGTGLPEHKTGAIWAMKFSKDGKYMATGGQDMVVRVWAVISSPEERAKHEKMEERNTEGQNAGYKLNAPVFASEPLHEFRGHTADVLDLSWSRNNFLLSSSMDKTVRLWHVTQKVCLACFEHSDFVTAIAFHPKDDRFFLSGALDCKLRLWSIPDKEVAYWNELPELITAVAFTPDGNVAIAGSFTGLCLFYETEGLRYHTQVHVRSSRGRNSRGSKITGIETVSMPPDNPHGDCKLLITSNDSRIRMYDMRDKSLETKFKGNENTCSQIRATFSDDGRYVICGSEDRQVYIWDVNPGSHSKKDRRGCEHFEAHSAIVTVAAFAPIKSKQLLTMSGDPTYRECKDTANGRARSSSLASSYYSPARGDHGKMTTDSSTTSKADHPTHPDGNIIVCADYTGRIKVFRQDCAYHSFSDNISETSSRRTISSLFRRRSTLSQHSATEANVHGSWRNSAHGLRMPSTPGSLRGSMENTNDYGHTDSPTIKGVRREQATPASAKSKEFVTPRSAMSRKSVDAAMSPASPVQVQKQTPTPTRQPQSQQESRSREQSVIDTMLQEGGLTSTYYNMRVNTQRMDSGLTAATVSTQATSTDDESDDEFFDPEEEDQGMRCKRCGATNFKVFRDPKHPSHTQLRCARCNHLAG
ncbi:hypothetical protein YB2330_000479 [Saitoella coloradoensis]